jgi:hypothetical protein
MLSEVEASRAALFGRVILFDTCHRKENHGAKKCAARSVDTPAPTAWAAQDDGPEAEGRQPEMVGTLNRIVNKG